MISWSDKGIVLSARKHAEKYKIVDIFTKTHGKFSAMVYISKKNTMAMFSCVDIDYTSKSDTSLGFWKLKDEKQNWIYSLNSENHLLVCQSICFLLSKVLPFSLPHEELFNFTEYIGNNLSGFSGTEILSLYAYFEFVLLDNIGFGLDPEKFSEQHKITSKEDIPSKLWIDWKNNESFSNTMSNFDIKNSLKITGDIIEKHIHPVNNYFRSSICGLI
jgi:DNA repair protein RecO